MHTWAACLFALVFLPVARAAGPDPIGEPVTAPRLSALSGNRVAWATAENDLGEVAGDLRLSHLTIVVKRSAERQQAFELFLAQQQDPSSPNFHHWLTPRRSASGLVPTCAT